MLYQWRLERKRGGEGGKGVGREKGNREYVHNVGRRKKLTEKKRGPGDRSRGG